MTLSVGDFSKFNGPAPDYSACDAVILNCTPQNIYFQAQYSKAVAEGKLIGYYSWPLAFGPTGAIDGAQCALALQGLHAGPVFYDIEQGSYSGDPVSLSLAFVLAIQSAGRGGHLYVEGGLVSEYDFTPLVNANAGLWVAQYGSSQITVSLGAWSQVGPLGWQYTSTPTDESTFYLDAAGWAAISVPPGSTPPPTPEDDMPYSQWSQADKIALYCDIWGLNGGLAGAPLVPNLRLGHGEWPYTLLGANEQRIENELLPIAAVAPVNGHTDAAVKAIPVPQIALTDAQVASLAQTLKAELPAAQIQALAAQLQK